MMNKIKALLEKLPFDTKQLLSILGMVVLLVILIAVKPFKGISNMSQFILSFFLLFTSAVILLQIFFKKDTKLEKKIVTETIEEISKKKKDLSEKQKQVEQELEKKTTKAKETKDTIKKLKEEKEELNKTDIKKDVDVKTASKKLKNL